MCACTKKRLFFGAIVFLIFAILFKTVMDYIYFDYEELMNQRLKDSEEQRARDMEFHSSNGLNFTEYKNQAVYLEPETATDYPIIVWWTPFTGYSRIVHNCNKGSCLFTHSRTEFNNSLTEAFMFYGTQMRWTDLPLPRDPNHLWVLLHEESPKNNWLLAFNEGISLFNLTATSSEHSSYTLVTQHLESIDYLMRPMKYSTSQKSQGDIGLVMYIHSDCDTPSDRDSYAAELMKYVKVDSYGKCLHNKDLPEHLRDPVTSMDSDELTDITAQYKFTLAIENAYCEGYITEKIWRPMRAGSVPIIKSSPTIKDWAPHNHSIIVIDDFPNPEALAKYLLYLDQHDEEYEKYLEFKKVGVTNERLLKSMNERKWASKIQSYEDINMVEAFECFVCDTIHERKIREKDGETLEPLLANQTHFNCSMPVPLLENSTPQQRQEIEFWRQLAKQAEYQAKAIAPAIAEGRTKREVAAIFDHAATKMSHEDWMLQ